MEIDRAERCVRGTGAAPRQLEVIRDAAVRYTYSHSRIENLHSLKILPVSTTALVKVC